MKYIEQKKNLIRLHFEITEYGRITITDTGKNDTKLKFKNRKASTIKRLGEAFIIIAEKAEKLGRYK